MGAPTLFAEIKTNEQLLDSIDRQAAQKFKRFHWTVTSSKDERNHRSALATFVGTDNKGHNFVKTLHADSLGHALFLVEEFLTRTK